MWLYPLPALVSLALWIYIFFSPGAACPPASCFSVAFLVAPSADVVPTALANLRSFRKKNGRPSRREAAVRILNSAILNS